MCLYDNFFVVTKWHWIGNIVILMKFCENNNCQCSQRWKCHQNEDISVLGNQIHNGWLAAGIPASSVMDFIRIFDVPRPSATMPVVPHSLNHHIIRSSFRVGDKIRYMGSRPFLAQSTSMYFVVLICNPNHRLACTTPYAVTNYVINKRHHV